MKRYAILVVILSIVVLLSSCYDHIQRGDEYFVRANEAIRNDSIIQAYSFIEKAIDEYRQGKEKNKENKAKIFMSLLYFSTDQKDKAYEIIKDMKVSLIDDEDYLLYSNYFRIKAFFYSVHEKNGHEAVALIDSVIQHDIMHAPDNLRLLNLDRLNKCEILLNEADTSEVAMLLNHVISTTELPSPLEPQIYANMARYYDISQQRDSAYKYAGLVVDHTSRMHEDIDNNIFALEIILRYDSIDGNLADYICYRNLLESLKEKRQGESVRFGMAFVNAQNEAESLRIRAEGQKRTWLFVAISISLLIIIVLGTLIHRHRNALIKNEMIQLECDRLDAEAFRRKLENELLRGKINSKSDELDRANNEILELYHQLARKHSEIDNADASYIQRLLDSVEAAYPDFQKRLVKEFPDISKTELTLASLIKLNLSSEEISTSMSISKSGLVKARYRLRKRLGIDSSAELDNFIAAF